MIILFCFIQFIPFLRLFLRLKKEMKSYRLHIYAKTDNRVGYDFLFCLKKFFKELA